MIQNANGGAWQAALAMQMPAVEPVAKFDDPRVQAVYEILCSYARPPADEHWEGFTARRIVDTMAVPTRKMTKEVFPEYEQALLEWAQHNNGTVILQVLDFT